MRALIFPGQGSQHIGMGKSLADASATCRQVFEEVDDSVNFALSKLMFDGDADTLRLTMHAQPALMAVSVAVSRLWCERAGHSDISSLCGAVAGHSLGEYTALTVAKSISLADSARTLKARGEAMQKAVPVGEGGMVAVLGLAPEAVLDLAASIPDTLGVCELANDNAPGQVVLSGTTTAMAEVVKRAKEFGAKRGLSLPVSAPFHCSMMHRAQNEMTDRLHDLAISAPVVPCYGNVDASATQDTETIRKKLIAQICAPVRWRESIARMSSDGCSEFIELGAGKVLSGMMKRNAPGASTLSIQDVHDIEVFLNA